MSKTDGSEVDEPLSRSFAMHDKFKLNLTIGEDLIYCLDCINCSNSIIAYNECLYNYIKKGRIPLTPNQYNY